MLGPGAGMLLVLSCITPASSLFIIVPEMLATQGSGDTTDPTDDLVAA